jgi:hypothetical protein
VIEAIVDLDERTATIVGQRPDGQIVEEAVALTDIHMGHLGYVELRYADGSKSPRIAPRCLSSVPVRNPLWAYLGIAVAASVGMLVVRWLWKRRTSPAEHDAAADGGGTTALPGS